MPTLEEHTAGNPKFYSSSDLAVGVVIQPLIDEKPGENIFFF